ncbi:gag-pol polyprotein [Tanacetum coccineum]
MEMTWHATGKCMEPGKMQHPVDDRAWKKFDTWYPDFAAGPINVRLGLAADGFNLFDNLKWATLHDMPTCNEDTPSMCVLSKTAYVGHRRFLKKPHKWRKLRDFNGETEDGDPPRKFNWAQIQTQLDRLPTLEKGKHMSYEGVKIKCNVLVELDWTR